MLHDGESQPCAAPLFGMTFIHSVEPLKDSLLMLFRYPDPGIIHLNFWAIQCAAYPDRDTSALYIIFDRILSNIVDHLIQDLPDSHIGYRLS